MCYHYSLTKKQEEIMRMISAEWETPFAPVHHATGYSFPALPVLTCDRPGLVQQYQWGLIPHWVQRSEEAGSIRAQTLNARSETLFEKPAFRSYVQNRCVVLADGFFEWMEFKKKKYPHYVRLGEGELFGFAGLFAHWTDKETGELLRTFTVITTAANGLMERIHNTKKRMPVVLDRTQWPAWLAPNLSREDMQSLLQPCSDAGMQAHTVSRLITSRGADPNVPEVHQPFAYPELSAGEQGSLFHV